MYLQCTQCLHAFEAPTPSTACPRCGAPPPGFASSPQGPAAGAVPQTMAMDSSMLANMLRSSVPAGGSVAPPQAQQQAQGHPPASQGFAQGSFHPHASMAPPQGLAAPPSFGAPPVQPWAPSQPQVSPSQTSSHAVVSMVLAAVSFLGGCNLIGLAGVFLGLRAYQTANSNNPAEAHAQARTARVVSVVALVLTVLVWAVAGAWIASASSGG